MSDWSIQRVEQLATDSAAFKAAQGTAKPAKWRNLGRDDRLVWGECQGSGSTPYQVRVDLIDVTYKCSCPSRKLPCKHTLGLLLMVAGGTKIDTAAPPEFVAEWSANRARRAEAKQARETKEAAAPAPDPAAKARRAEKRETRVVSGLDQLEVWLADIIGQGLAVTRAQGPAFWSQMASRLVDAQAPGLARRVRDLGELAMASQQWQDELLGGLARLQLLIDGYRGIDRLPPELAAEVRSIVGWTQEQEALRARAGTRDRWQVIARRQTDDETLKTQFTWLHGATSNAFALVLEFAVGAQPLPATYSVGQVIDAELVFFDGCPPIRALEKERFSVEPRQLTLPTPRDIATLQTEYSQRLATNPWFERMPFVLGPVLPVFHDGRLQLRDAADRRIPVAANCRHTWDLIALAGGDSVSLFGEWTGNAFDPYSVERNGQLYTLARIADLPLLSRVA
jgi:hypothetical protein